MKRKLVTIGYLLWSIGFYPMATITSAVVGLPYFVSVYLFHWISETSAKVGFVFYGFLFGLLIGCLILSDDIKKNGLCIFYKMILTSAIKSSFFFFFWCFGLMIESTVLEYVLWLGIPDVLIASGFLIPFVKESRKEYRLNRSLYCNYPEDRDILIKVARDHSSGEDCRLVALKKLPYPEERETIVQITLNDSNSNICFAALKKIPYPEERETIVQIMLTDRDSYIRLAALEKLPYPEERESIIQIMLTDQDSHIRLAAFEKLPYPEERVAIVRKALEDSDWHIRQAALEKLPYSEERQAVVQIALNDSNSDTRLAAIKKLPYPEEWKAIVQIALNDSYGNARAVAAKKISYTEEMTDVDRLELITMLEKVIQNDEIVNERFSDSPGTIAANALASLYLNLRLPKDINHIHSGSHGDYHVDEIEYQDMNHPEYNDYHGCGDFSYGSGPNHTDHHVDAGHEDYYHIIEKK